MTRQYHIASFTTPSGGLIPFGDIEAPTGGEFMVILEQAREEPWVPMELSAKASDQNSPIHGIDLGDCWTNGAYTVHVRTDEETGAKHLSIKRVDKRPCHDWRDFQRIKNDICGPEWEAIEIYPAMSRLVDSSNQYHLWAFPEGIGIGFPGRFTTSRELVPNSKQRPLPAEWEESIPVEVAQMLGVDPV